VLPRWPAFLMLLTVALAAACSSTHHQAHANLTAPQLAGRIMPAPDGYKIDPTPHARGAMSPALFSQFGGAGSAAQLGFVAGFRQNYVDYGTQEGIAVTVIEFSSPQKASSYLQQTGTKTLNYAAATYKPFTQVPGAIQADGTKAYGGEYSHAVVAATRNFYYQLLYVNASPSPVPQEFYTWAKSQWALLQ
jgi:hypothetical protein